MVEEVEVPVVAVTKAETRVESRIAAARITWVE